MIPRTLVIVVALIAAVAARQDHHPAFSSGAILLTGLGPHHHPIATASDEAQKFFDQGLTLVYGFNHDEAIRSFQRAADLDSEAAMPYWGVALALGPNINLDIDRERERAAYDAVEKAHARAEGAPEHERAYIEALRKRYSADPHADLKKLAVEYSQAMEALVARYPDDLDLATLYAESLMDLNPWKLWSADGRPAERTLQIVRVLESVLRRDPNHVGANHYYIHAVEASPAPERALPSAARLGALVPAAGHLVHMPAHIYARVGDHAAAARSNEAAAEADRAYLKLTGAHGTYPLMYYSHNLHFLVADYSMDGRFSDARRSADQLTANLAGVAEDPMAEPFVPTQLFLLLRFQRWDEVLHLPPPGGRLKTATLLWHMGRGIAFAATGNLDKAEAENAACAAAEQDISNELRFGNSHARTLAAIARHSLEARIAGAKHDGPAAIAAWKAAVQAQDSLSYDEPPDWYYPVRESLGAALLRNGEAREAESVFRTDLDNNPRNGRSLYGLWQSLEAQQKSDADWVRRQFDWAWKNAEVKLRIDDF